MADGLERRRSCVGRQVAAAVSVAHQGIQQFGTESQCTQGPQGSQWCHLQSLLALGPEFPAFFSDIPAKIPSSSVVGCWYEEACHSQTEAQGRAKKNQTPAQSLSLGHSQS